MKIDAWLTLLEGEQQEATKIGLPLGSIPSFRTYPLFQIKRSDPNVFFPALIAGKLQEWKHLMTSSQTARADKIIAGIVGTFPLYNSRRGRMHYNFWPTNPDIPFPNGKALHRFDFFRLPDDIDDTALVYSALSSNKLTILSLQQDIDEHFLRHYPKQPRMYAAWLGDKMPWVVDACAMINLLSLFQHQKLLPTTFTGTSEAYLKDIILTKRYIKTPYEVAPYYPDSAVIAYHLAKWLSGDREKLEPLIAGFVSDVEALLATEWNDFKAMLYAISLLKVGVRPLREIELYQLEGDSYPWFYGSMLSAVKPRWLQKMGRFRLFHIAHSCPAWNHTLWVEYTLLKKVIEK
jgi:hypothetical protein